MSKAKNKNTIQWDSLPFHFLMFRKSQDFKIAEKTRLTQISPFLTDQVLDQYIIPLLQQKHRVSLRVLEWVVTNFSKERRHLIVKNNFIVDIFADYNNILSESHRGMCDSFRRGPRIYFMRNNELYETTCGQLYFLIWTINMGIFKYAEDHIDEVTNDIKLKAKAKSIAGKRRKEITVVKNKRCIIYDKPLKYIIEDEEEQSLDSQQPIIS